MKLLHIVGNRPQFIKLSPVLRASEKHGDMKNIVVHSGQHYDYNMSKVFFDELGIAEPDYNLNVGSGTHGIQTGNILTALDPILTSESPDCVLVYGDTNTTLAGALAAYKMHYPCAHVESGVREYVKRAEEMNRKAADNCSDFLFCPIKRAADNLTREGIEDARIFVTGDVTYDAFIVNSGIADRHNVLGRLGLSTDRYILLTLHRAETVDVRNKLGGVVEALVSIGDTIVFPAHPRTKGRLEEFGLLEKLEKSGNVFVLEPVGYFEFLNLLRHSKLVMADSGGVIKEAFYAGKPCISLDHTGGHEKVFEELIDLKYVIIGKTKEDILSGYNKMQNGCPAKIENNIYGDGHAAEKIIEILSRELRKL